ncbi:DUF2794 domain-containing protein [Parvularcula sp. LCG005]|nr:DUF2794 domain-containing protein [Parvularcula sp. LCG005]WOI53067.1 DUF2794 domain-containing protein [Parvularcula sp. LCG005]
MSQPSPRRPVAEDVYFSREELDQILSLYGYFVAAGEWKDYAIGGAPDRAVFSIFRRTSEAPMYRIEKRPKLRQKQGAYSVVAMGGQILKRGADLRAVLKVFDRQKLKLIS